MWREMLSAARFSRTAHAGQRRAHGAPYFTHPAAVAHMLWKWGCRAPAVLQAAYLHDTVEDCGVSLETLRERFGPETARLVEAVTKRPGEDREAYFARVKAAGPEAMLLKYADREHNNSELAKAPPEATALREKAAAKTAMMMRVFFGS